MSIEKFKNKKIAVLCGGISGEREVSLRSGKRVFDSLVSQGLDAVMIDTKEDFIPRLKQENIELACIMLHGAFGEDGAIQGLLEVLGIPYTGSKVLASALGMNKVASKRVWQSLNIPTPKYAVIDRFADIDEQCAKILKYFPFPLVVKPVSEGSSLGVTILKDPAVFASVVKDTVQKHSEVFIEEFIGGVQITVGILGTGQNLKALPVLELRPKTDFYDYSAKYTKGMTEFIIPAGLAHQVYLNSQRTALHAFKAIGCSGFARIDMIVDKDGTAYVHDANTIPGMTDLSDLPAQAAADGISYDELVLHILESAL
ncbi:MAG: D-alanine--D-alanine ligase [Candidatus Margulisiibacteriota bacterium]